MEAVVLRLNVSDWCSVEMLHQLFGSELCSGPHGKVGVHPKLSWKRFFKRFLYFLVVVSSRLVPCAVQACDKAQELKLIHLSRKAPSVWTLCHCPGAPLSPWAGEENSCYHHFCAFARFQMLRRLIPVTLLLQSRAVFVPTKHQGTGDPGLTFINIPILSFWVCIEFFFRPWLDDQADNFVAGWGSITQLILLGLALIEPGDS